MGWSYNFTIDEYALFPWKLLRIGQFTSEKFEQFKAMIIQKTGNSLEEYESNYFDEDFNDEDMSVTVRMGVTALKDIKSPITYEWYLSKYEDIRNDEQMASYIESALNEY